MTSGEPASSPKPSKRSISWLMVLIITVGLAGAGLAMWSNNIRSQTSLEQRALTIADTLPITDILALDGDETDLTKPEYQHLKSQLMQVTHHNQDLRFTYLMGKQDNNIIFLADSEPVDSEGYSAPGESYPEASPELRNIYQTKQAFVEGPSRDSFGVWLSGIAPIVNPQTSQVVGVVGVDIAAFDFYFQSAIYGLTPLILAAVPLVYIWRNRKLEAKEKELTQLKKQFISIASHELRSPLTGILWGIQSLLGPKSDHSLTQKQQSLLNDMYQSTESSLATVNEILDASIFERGKSTRLQQDIVELISIVQSVEKVLVLGAEEHKIKLVHTGVWPTAAYSRGDLSALKRAFMNILSNAIKYSPANTSIELSFEQKDEQYVIRIKDQGIGIPADEMTKVLSGYYRASNAGKMDAHGTGLGLWVTKAIIEEQHGSFGLTSKENEGTTVSVGLLVVQAPHAQDSISRKQ